MKALLFVGLFLVSGLANAAADPGVYGYAYWGPRFIREYLDQVDNSSPREGAPQCQNLYSSALKKGVLDIRYALGYFDDSTGQDSVVNGINYGMSPSLDIEVFNALRKELTSRCRSRSIRLCGFKESGDAKQGKVVLQKNIEMFGQTVLVRMTLTQASATPSFTANKGSQSDRQTFLTQQSEDSYFGGLKTADIVLYNGHSRNGGGPDFAPPILNSANKVNYKGYYEIKRPGIQKVMAALEQNPNKGIVVGFFSCYSRMHFYNTFIKSNPSQRLILSAETIDYVDSLKASVGYLEGFLRGTCGEELASTAKKYDKIRTGFQGYNLK